MAESVIFSQMPVTLQGEEGLLCFVCFSSLYYLATTEPAGKVP